MISSLKKKYQFFHFVVIIFSFPVTIFLFFTTFLLTPPISYLMIYSTFFHSQWWQGCMKELLAMYVIGMWQFYAIIPDFSTLIGLLVQFLHWLMAMLVQFFSLSDFIFHPISVEIIRMKLQFIVYDNGYW